MSTKQLLSLRKSCFKCALYVVEEGRVGYCKLFGNFKTAREDTELCGPIGKFFKPVVFQKEVNERQRA